MKRILQFFLTPYAESTLDIRIKIKMLVIINLTLITGLLIAILLQAFIEFNLSTLLSSLGIALINAFSLLLIFKKRYQPAVVINNIFFTLGACLMLLIEQQQISSYRYVAYVLVVYLVCCAISYSKNQIILVTALTFCGFAALLILKIFPQHDWNPVVMLSNELVIPVIMLILASIIAYSILNVTTEILKMTLQEKDLNFSRLKKIEGILKTSKNYLQLGKNLTVIAAESSHSTGEMSETLQESKNDVQKLSHEIMTAARAIDQIVESINGIMGLIEEHASSITQSTSAISEMDASISSIARVVETQKTTADQLAVTASQGMEQMDQAVESVNKITRSTNEMLDMIQIVNNIAGQTDLLAMNAAIEAAHAGDAGRGFAVVAEEIRKLSEETASSARQINISLKNTVNGIQEADQMNEISGQVFARLVDGIQTITTAMEESLGGIQEIKWGSGEIVTALNALLTITEKIRKGAREINTNIHSISSNMSEVIQISDSTLTGIENLSLGAGYISQAMDNLSAIGRENESNILLLDKELSEL